MNKIIKLLEIIFVGFSKKKLKILKMLNVY